jgi:predicted phosphodiesterase
MRVAALYDIHGNLPALDAVLGEVRRAGVDRIVVGGDVLPGPIVGETLERLLALDVPAQFICGNGEVAVLAELAGGTPAVPERFRDLIRWCAREADAYRGALSAWPKTLRLDVPGIGGVLFCHATPRNENEIFTKQTPEDRLKPIFDPLDVSLVVCGHTHMPFDRTIGRVRVVNAGSVGMPFGPPGADWLLLGPGVQLRRTAYDLQAAAARVRATAYPQAEEFAARSILQPPSEQEMLDLYARAELK